MKKLLLAALLIFGFMQHSNAQRFDYDQSSNVFVGLNVGYVWHTSDVKNAKKRFPLGAGFTLGGTFNRDYGKFFTYDLRFRFLFGSWYGQDRDTTQAIKENYAVNNLYDTLGYAVQNFRAKQRSLDLEFAVHFNRVKENTGFDPYIFGGIGFTFTNTKGDLLKNNNVGGGTIYPYNEDPSGDLISKNYDTPLDKNGSGEPYDGFEANFLPSLGVGIGYYFSTNFSIGLEHMTTFFNGDHFDGTHLNQDGQPSRIKNDLYHYTSIYFKWYLKKGNNRTVKPENETYTPPKVPVNQNPNDVKDPVVDNKPIRKRPPIVHFTNPLSKPLKTTQSTISIRVKTAYVNSADDIVFTKNGIVHKTFIFKPKEGDFESNVSLNLGKNKFTITGVNEDGSDSDETVVIYEKEAPQDAYPPSVNIVDPGSKPLTVNQLNYVVKAAIHNVKARNQIKVIFNNQPFTAFSFSPTGDINFSANLNLRSGVNKLKIIGQNSIGTDQDEAVLVYTRAPAEDTGYPPTVEIITPNRKPFTTSKTEVNIIAKINHVLNEQQIEVVINGVSTTNFDYDIETKMAQFNASISSGYNSIRVKAKNPYGTAMDELQIIYQRGYDPNGSNLPPLVAITSPNVNPYTSETSQQAVNARLEHIENKEQIEVKVNGIKTTNFTFTPSTGIVQLNANLSKGSNIINVKGSNTFGSDSDVSQIIYRERVIKGDPPKIKITTPSVHPLNTSKSSEKVIAKVENINQKDQIKVTVNGANISNFSFNSPTKQIQMDVSLSFGNNTVKITATNTMGSASDETQISRVLKKKPEIKGNIKLPPCDPPSIEFLTPKGGVYTTLEKSFEVTAKLSNIQNKNQITVFLNNRKLTDFSYDVSTKLLKHTINLNEGKSTYIVRLTNDCSSKDGEITLKYEPPVCGVDIMLINSDFCLAKPGGKAKRDDLLTNSNFQYDGEAKLIYFKAANNGFAKVNGVDYPLVKGTVYHFMGQVTVQIENVNNQWHVCIESARNPLFGTGSSRPEYPCGESIEINSIEGTKGGTKPVVKPRPTKSINRPTPKPTKEDSTTEPKKEPSKPASRGNKGQRRPR